MISRLPDPPHPGRPVQPNDEAQLERRLQAVGAGHIAVGRFLGHTAVARVFLAHDRRTGRAVTAKLVDSEMAYDVGGPEFARGIGSVPALRDPHVLAPGTEPGAQGAICYFTPYVPAVSLGEHLSTGGALPFIDAVRIAADAARALGHWYRLGVGYGCFRMDALLLQHGQIMLPPPDESSYQPNGSWRDVRNLARFILDLRNRCADWPHGNLRWQRLRAQLRRAAEGQGSPSLSVADIADALAWLEHEAEPPGRSQAGLLRRWLAALRASVRRGPADPGDRYLTGARPVVAAFTSIRARPASTAGTRSRRDGSYPG